MTLLYSALKWGLGAAHVQILSQAIHPQAFPSQAHFNLPRTVIPYNWDAALTRSPGVCFCRSLGAAGSPPRPPKARENSGVRLALLQAWPKERTRSDGSFAVTCLQMGWFTNSLLEKVGQKWGSMGGVDSSEPAKTTKGRQVSNPIHKPVPDVSPFIGKQPTLRLQHSLTLPGFHDLHQPHDTASLLQGPRSQPRSRRATDIEREQAWVCGSFLTRRHPKITHVLGEILETLLPRLSWATRRRLRQPF